jgi:hypothetical protein
MQKAQAYQQTFRPTKQQEPKKKCNNKSSNSRLSTLIKSSEIGRQISKQ